MNAEIRQPMGIGVKVSSGCRAFYLRGRETLRRLGRGQTMAEYALILAAVATVVFLAYQSMGQSIESMVVWAIIGQDLSGS